MNYYGFLASVYKIQNGSSDTSANGISNRFNCVRIVGKIIEEFDKEVGVTVKKIQSIPLEMQVFKAREDAPDVFIGNIKDHFFAIPVELYLSNKKRNVACAGGSFIYSYDSRFFEFINEYPVSLHDRVEA